MALWTDAAAAPAIGKEGLLAEGFPCEVDSYIAETAVRAGFAVALGTDVATTQNQVNPLPALPAADANAIALAIPSALAGAVYTGIGAGALDGAVGIARIYPPQAISFTFNASADWDNPIGFTLCSVYGEDGDGRPTHEDVIRNNVGAAPFAVTTRQPFSRVNRVDVGAGSGVGGTLQVGTDPTYNDIGRTCFPGIAVYDAAREASAVAAVTFDAGETLSVMKRGRIWCVARTVVVPDDPVLVRTTAGGGILRGALYGIEVMGPGSAFARWIGARWITPAQIGGLAIVEVA